MITILYGRGLLGDIPMARSNRLYLVVLILMLIVIYINCVMVLVRAEFIDLDAYGGIYSGRILAPHGTMVSIDVSITRFDKIELIVSPTASMSQIQVTVRDPGGRIIHTRTIVEKTSIHIPIEVKGCCWEIQFLSNVDQEIYYEIVGRSIPPPPTSPTQQKEEVIPGPLLIIIGGTIGAVVIIIVIVLLLSRRRQAPPAPTPPVPTPTPPPTPKMPSMGETVVLEGKGVQKETEIMIAALELSDGKVVPVVSPRQVFGRSDFEKFIGSDAASYISRRHFMIILEPGGFYIEDLGSTNGTMVNDMDIRGKGKVPLKSGDTIVIGGVLKLRFKAA